jgi:hemoglobin|tara:strand:- start:97924 stop:98382 length:459 start_codon:yes stop_codon:yes gene_type:complete
MVLTREEKIARKTSETGIDHDMIDQLVRTFYQKIQVDPVLAPIFNDLIDDWEPHLLKMIDFWSSATLKSGKYKGNPLVKHLSMPIDARFFDHWLELFTKTAVEICPPKAAAVFKEKSRMIAQSLELGIAVNNGTLPIKGNRYINQSLNFPDE